MSLTPAGQPRAWSVEGFERFWSDPRPERVAAIHEVVTQDVVGHWPQPFGLVRSAAPYVEVIHRLVTHLPGFRLRVAEWAANGEFRFVRWIATGKSPHGAFECTGIDRLRLREGQVCENFVVCEHPFFRWAAEAHQAGPA